MARSHARILVSIWRDPDFIALPAAAQRLFFLLLSQPNVSHCGLVPLTVRRWAACSPDDDPARIVEALGRLEAARFVVSDLDTEEVLVRSLLRNDGVWRQPNVMLSAASDARHISSPRLREALLDELDRLPLDELSDTACKDKHGNDKPTTRAQVRAIVEGLRASLARGSEKGSPKGSPKGSRQAEPATSLSPSPTPTPTPTDPPGAALPALHAEQPTPTPIEAAAAQAVVENSGTLLAEYIRACRRRPPNRFVGQLSKQIQALLAEGFSGDEIRAGMDVVRTRGLDASTLPSAVNQALNAQPRGLAVVRSTTEDRVGQAIALSERLAREGR